MSELVLSGDIGTALTHLTLVGLAAIFEDEGFSRVRVWWRTDGLDARPVVDAPALDWRSAAEAVRTHAVRHCDPGDWTAAKVLGGTAALMSPRIKPPGDDAEWRGHVAARRAVIDREVARSATLDLRLIGSLGEPAYWRRNRQGQRLPDDGASRWEMKTRNRGEEFVGNRLHPLAERVARRTPDQIEAGLTGTAVVDELGKNDVDSRTATGLAAPGPTDNGVAWCALWGLSQFPVIAQVERPSRTAGHLPATSRAARDRRGSFYVPVPSRPMGLPRLRSVVLSGQLALATSLEDDEGDRLDVEAARSWLADRGIGAIVRFSIGEYGSANAPERRALLGRVLPTDRS